MAEILVIEDAPAVLLSLKIVLQGAGHSITQASDGAVGLRLIEDHAFDLVITDVWMPGLHGSEVIREGRQRSPQTRFLAITGGDPNGPDPEGGLRLHDFKADAILYKPFEKNHLLAAVERLLDA